ncbi:MAG: cobyric acid synthase [Ruminococcus sp.]|nr:cobyric acid synthase [Ruminococcus sp.]
MAKAIMLQGTMSNVGKSFLTAALCRIFRQDGFAVAPFKSQNMALNSFITSDGSEIGRAQALQAEAAGIEPSALMNPILLKPTTNVGSQVIVNGQVYANMKAADYFRHKEKLIPYIMNAYQSLAEQYDIIVIEGAGSPVELNLKADDIVNMGLAKMVNAPVLLVGDIDRGGIFAQLIGTLDLLESCERDMVKGIIVNQFRGDISLFEDGISILEHRSGKHVSGVIPYIKCEIEDEDSLSQNLMKYTSDKLIDIAVIKLPKMSNFTDFDVFRQYDGVSVRFVSDVCQLGKPDIIMIPGTKSTIDDMNWMRKSGIESTVIGLVKNGVPIFGICGGYQILGGMISDPFYCESGGAIAGMGLLNCDTVFDNKKYQQQVKGHFCEINGFFSCLSGADFYGYEVHMGKTIEKSSQLTNIGGCFLENAAGCYVHGIFDCAEVSGRLIKQLFKRNGLKYKGEIIDRKQYRNNQLDLLADIVRKNLDMEFIYKVLEEGI